MPSPKNRWKANLFLVAVAAIWGSAFVAQRVASRAGLGFLYNGVSFGIAGLVLVPLTLKRRKPSLRQWRWMIAAGVLLFGGSACQQIGLNYTLVANASFLTSLYVIFTPFLLWVGYREKPHAVHLIAASLAMVGAFLLSTGGTLTWRLGDALEVLGALFWGMHIVLISKYAGRFDSITFASGQFLICGFLNFAVGVFFEPISALFLAPVVAAVAYRSILSIAVGYTAQVWAQKFTSPVEASLIYALESVAAAIVATLVLDEHLIFIQAVGCTMILGAAGLSQIEV
jgi:drug/metabolite transporter (DMT)-like permease